MNTLTKMALGMLGQLKSARAAGYAVDALPLAPPRTGQFWPLVQVLQQRHSPCEFDPATHREAYAWLSAGAMAQSAFLYCARASLATVVRAWIDRHALAQAMGLSVDEPVLVAQTVGVAASGVRT